MSEINWVDGSNNIYESKFQIFEMKRDYVFFFCNGKPIRVKGLAAFQTLSTWLRKDKQLTGTKVVCAEGDCGACTVLLGCPRSENIKYEAVNSCILNVHQLDGMHVITIEGLAWGDRLHPVQQAMRDGFGSQCGYCTPGIVMALAANVLVDSESTRKRLTAKEALIGNLCRCTGYEAIIDSAEASKKFIYWKLADQYPPGAIIKQLKEETKIPFELQEIDPSLEQEIQRKCWKPRTLKDALEIKLKHPEARWLAGGTDLCVLINKERIDPKELISTSEIPELCGIREVGNHLIFGGNVSWRELEEWAQVNWPNLKDMLDLFASPQIRNRGTIAGNLANASPVADSLPWLYVSEAEIGTCDGEKWRWIPIEKFYKGYKLLDLRQCELIGAIRIQKSHQSLSQRLFKVSKRRDLDISTFTAAIQWQIVEGRFQQIRLAYGGVGPTVIRLHKTEKVLLSKPCTQDLIEKAGKIAAAEISPISDVRSSNHYRNRLAETILKKFFHEEISVAA